MGGINRSLTLDYLNFQRDTPLLPGLKWMVNPETSREVSLSLPVPPARLWTSSSRLCHVWSGVSRAMNSSAVLQWWRNVWKLNQDVREASFWPWMRDVIMSLEMGGTLSLLEWEGLAEGDLGWELTFTSRFLGVSVNRWTRILLRSVVSVHHTGIFLWIYCWD